MVWTPTRNGGLCAIVEGKRFVKNGTSKSNPLLQFFHCADKKKCGCPGKIWIIGDTYEVVTDCIHEGACQQSLVNAMKAKEAIRAGAATSQDTAKLVNDAYDFLRSDEKALLTKKSSLQRLARDIQNKGAAVKLPVEPDSLDDLGKFHAFLFLSTFHTTLCT